MQDKGKGSQDLAASLKAVAQTGLVSRLSRTPDGQVEVTLRIPKDSIRAAGVRESLATLTDSLM